ncbi:MAG: K+ channel, inward rectifier [Bacteroidia bacterium]|nr:K+ channel, inward rectifier [Bacteroidia bacterium]
MRFKKVKEPEQAGSDLGFGNKDGGNARGLNKDGSFNVIRKGVPLLNKFETFHALISMSWIKFYLTVFSLYFIVNLLFAALYMLAGIENLAGIQGITYIDKFWESFFFSSQTLTTLGYGRISPVGELENSIASVESMIGLMSFALVTGLVYGRFSRPGARIKYSRVALIAPYKNTTAFMFRLVNERRNQLIEVEAGVTFSVRNKENNKIRNFYGLKLEITKINFFPLS